MTNTAAAPASAMMNNPLAVSAHLFRPIPSASSTAVRLLTPHLPRTGRHWEGTGRLWAPVISYSSCSHLLLEAAGTGKSRAPGSKAGGGSECNSYK